MADIEKAQLKDKIPRQRIDKKKIVEELCEKIQDLRSDRQQWVQRQTKFLTDWDDFIADKRKGLWQNSANFHLPISMIHCKSMHARLMRSIFGVYPWFMVLPREKLDINRLQTIDQLMRWAITGYSNNHKGIQLTIDDWLWDIVTVGWGVLKLRWDHQVRKSMVVEEEPIIDFDTSEMDSAQLQAVVQQGMQQGMIQTEQVERSKFLTTFDGPILETCNHVDILFPGSMQDSTDLDQAHIVSHVIRLSPHDLKVRAARGIFDPKAVNKLIKDDKFVETQPTGGTIEDYLEITKDRHHGVDTVNAKERDKYFTIHEVYTRYDIDKDGFDEEVVFWIHPGSGTLLRWTYLDRITKTGKRPFYKADLIRRPRRSYGLGLVELLHPINREADAIHNQRVDYGSISNMPFFFYRASSGLKPEEITISPGMGVPVDDINDVRFVETGNKTNWGFQEEGLLNNYADKLSSLSDISRGEMPSPVGGARTATGMLSLIEQSGMQLDVIIKRVQNGYSEALTGMHSLLQERMPLDIEWRVINPDGSAMLDQSGLPMTRSLESRFDIQGKVDFQLVANSANSNRELEKQNAMLLSQMLLNPILLQTGIVGPDNIYNIVKNVIDKYGVIDCSKFLTPVQTVQRPLSIEDEASAIIQGMKPQIVLNDNHEAKIQGLGELKQHEMYQEGITNGTIHAESMAILDQCIAEHAMAMQAMQAQAQVGNITGLQIAPSLGARVAGQVDPGSQQALAQGGQQPQQPQQPNMRREQ